MSFEQISWGPLAASALIVTLPVLILTIVGAEGDRPRPDGRGPQGRLSQLNQVTNVRKMVDTVRNKDIVKNKTTLEEAMKAKDPKSGVSRRSLLRSSVAIAGASAAGSMFGLPPAFSQSGFDWKKFKGEKIEIALQKSPFHDVLQKFEPEFTELTGIQVGSEQIPEQQYRQKLAIEFASGKPSFDACYVAQATQKRLFGKGKWLADLKPLLADAAITAPDLRFQGFLAGRDRGRHAGRRARRHACR